MSQPSSWTISDETRVRPAQKLPGRKIAGETVVVDPRRRKVIAMNPVGSVVWDAVERGASVAEMRAEVVARFRVTDEQARIDIAAFLQALRDEGLIEAAQ